MAVIELDYFEYANDDAAQAAYPSSDTDVPLIGDLLNEDCADISDWVDIDAKDGVSEVDPAGQFHFYCPSAEADELAGRQRDIGAYPAQYTLEIKLYFDTLGTLANFDFFRITCNRAGGRLAVIWATDGLFIHNGTWNEVGTDLVETGKWQTWRFVMDASGGDANAVVDVYLDNVLQATDVDASYTGTLTDGLTVMFLAGFTVNTECHIDWVKVANGLVPPVPNLQCYSEDTIIQQGTYSLKAIAQQTDSLNDTLTKSGLSIDLSDRTTLKLYVRADRTGTNIQARLFDSVGGWITKDVNITSIGSFIEIDIDISGVSNANKSNITKIEFKILNADSDTIYYIDNFYAPIVIVGNAVLFGINF